MSRGKKYYLFNFVKSIPFPDNTIERACAIEGNIF